MTSSVGWQWSRPPRVLHVGKFYPPHMGGIETHLQTLCAELLKVVDVHVVVANDCARAVEERLNDVPVSRMARRFTLSSAPVCSGVIRKIRQSKADLIHIHLPNPAAVLAYLLSGYRGPVVFTYHSDTVRQKVMGAVFEPFLHAALRRSSAIIATSPRYAETSTVLRTYGARCRVIPYGIRIDGFSRCDPTAVTRLKQRYGERLVLSVGRLVYYKGFENLIQAMTRVRARLLIVGDGPLRARLGEMAIRVGVADKVIFLGELQNDEVVPYYHAADVFALASVARSEAFGIVQIEAMAAGVPVVNTQLDSGVPYVSLDGITGITVPPEDPEAMAAAINRILGDPALRQAFSQAARLRAAEEFSVQTMAARTLALYQEVLLKSSAVRGLFSFAWEAARQ
jgi:glycosyltransferase involved in cell wall biosynthesis